MLALKSEKGFSEAIDKLTDEIWALLIFQYWICFFFYLLQNYQCRPLSYRRVINCIIQGCIQFVCTLVDGPLEPTADFCVTGHMYARGAGNEDDKATLEVIENIQACISSYIVKILREYVCKNFHFLLTDPTEIRQERVQVSVDRDKKDHLLGYGLGASQSDCH